MRVILTYERALLTTMVTILGLKGKVKERILSRSLFAFDALIRKGFSAHTCKQIMAKTGFIVPELAAIMGISSQTLKRKMAASDSLSLIESDRLFRLIYIYSGAMQLFENSASARDWLRHPQFGLEGQVPLEVLKTEIGAREVENLICRIIHGVVA